MEFTRGRTRSISCMRIEKIVGSGTFGVVYKAVDKMNDTDVALKRIKMGREHEGFPVTTIREIKFLNLMKNQHENIVYLREVVTYNDHDSDEPTVRDKGFNIGDVFMVFEFVDFDLSGLLKSGRVSFTEEHVKSFLHQLLKGVQFLHNSNILHRDLKSANLLVTKGNVLKIADWGLARSMTTNPSRKMTIPTVTLWYRSPELILGNRQYGSEIDMWSVGCILGEMMTRVAMFRGQNEASQLDVIFQVTGSPPVDILTEFKKLPEWDKLGFNKTYLSRMSTYCPTTTDRQFYSLLNQLLDLNPTTRVSAEHALLHPYFSENDIVEPHTLPSLDSIEGVTEYSDLQRQKEEYDNKQAVKMVEEQSRVKEQQIQAEKNKLQRAQQKEHHKQVALDLRKHRRQASTEVIKYVATRPSTTNNTNSTVMTNNNNISTSGGEEVQHTMSGVEVTNVGIAEEKIDVLPATWTPDV